MYKLKIELDSGEEFFMKIETRQRTPEQIEWLKENMGFSGDTTDFYHKVETLEEATEIGWFEMQDRIAIAAVLYDFKSLEIIRSDKDDNV